MEVNGQLQALVPSSLGEEPPVRNEWEAGLAPVPVQTLYRKEIFLSPAGNRTPPVQPVARRYTDLEILIAGIAK
jgi:hypothetical protein